MLVIILGNLNVYVVKSKKSENNILLQAGFELVHSWSVG